MGKDNVLQIRARLLEQLKDDLTEDYTAAEYISEEESGIPAGEVTVMFDTLGINSNDIFGEIFFLPDADDDAAVSYFECVLLISDTLDNADMPALSAECVKQNNASPAGYFYVDEENGRLLYKLGVPVSSDSEEAAVYKEMNMAVGCALSIVDRSVDELIVLAEG